VRFDGDLYFGCVNHWKDKLSSPITMLDETDYRKFTLWDGKRYIQYYDAGNLYRGSASLRKQSSVHKSLSSIWYGSPLFGIRSFTSKRIDQVMCQCKKLSVRDKMGKIGSDMCYVLDGRSQTSTYTIWINPKCGYSIVQAVIDIGPGARGTFGVTAHNEHRRLEVNNIQIREINGIYVPVAYKVHFEDTKDGQVYLEGDFEGKVADIIFHPDHKKLGSFVPKMRKGTLMRDRDFGLQYIWDGKKIVPNIDESVIKKIDIMSEKFRVNNHNLAGQTIHDTPKSQVNAPNDIVGLIETSDRSGISKIVIVTIIVIVIIGVLSCLWLLEKRTKNRGISDGKIDVYE
jgi:hypothetical protein